MAVDHKAIVRVVDDCSKFHLQNSVELLDDSIDIKLESPCHRSSPSPWRDSGSSTILWGFYQLATREFDPRNEPCGCRKFPREPVGFAHHQIREIEEARQK